MKIDLQKFLHPILPHFVGFAKIIFAKKGWKDSVFGVL
jgi:hypothetical protein